MTRIAATRTFHQNPVQWMPPAEPTSDDGIDWIAVERAMSADIPAGGLNPTEMRTAALILTRNGLSEREVGEHLHINRRQVARWKAAAKLAEGQQAATCGNDDCTDFPISRGLCNRHYKQLRLAEKAAAAGTSRCGSEPGYKTHRRYHTKVCEPCRVAHTEYGRAYAKTRSTNATPQLEMAA
ncbi:helix-turn-helix domain-containing protein [Streptomyces sp. NPDC015125]|uniref:helix-turn-helix domain-containing protein n=1 Tax=Streptomyces sp. NPDC015125 TaxID=3364938 RepID=UPI0037021CB4